MAPPRDVDLRAQLEALTARIETMQNEIDSLRSQSISETPSQVTLSKLPTELPVSALEAFSDTEDLRIYLQQCELCFDLQPSRFPTDYQKVGLILSFL